MSDGLTIEKVMNLMPKSFLPEKAQGVDAILQFHLSGEQAGDWAVTIRDGACSVMQGSVESPTLAISADGNDYLDVLTGKLNPMQAFGAGKIKLKGNLNLALKMMTYFKLPSG